VSLFSVREHLKMRGPSTVPALAARLHLAPGVVEGMLEHWIRRGLVEVVDGGCHTGGPCKSCGACGLGRLQWYRWRGRDGTAEQTPPAAIPIGRRAAGELR